MLKSDELQNLWYRVRQFCAAVRVLFLGGDTLTAADVQFLRSILTTPAQMALFDQMPRNDQRHALAVARTLRQAGFSQPALLQAGLLHDVGKTLDQPLPYRVGVVLLERLYPIILNRWSRAESLITTPALAQTIPRWRRPFVIHAQHPEIGAQWATQVACYPQAIELIARHQDRPRVIYTETDYLLAVLYWADNLN